MTTTKHKQKFKHGDLVRVADDLGPSMEHFTKGCRAIVIGSYRDQFGGSASREPEYTLFIEGEGESSWYHEHQLTFIEHNPALLETWKEHAEARHRDRVDLKWIKTQWPKWKVEKCYPPSSSIVTLLDAIGFRSRFHANGEYFVLYADFTDLFGLFDLLLTKTWEEVDKERKPDAPEETRATMKKMWEAVNP